MKHPVKNPHRPMVVLLALVLLGCQEGQEVKFNAKKSPSELAGELFDTEKPDHRREAIAALAKQKWGHDAAYIKAYRTLATDPDPTVRAQAMRALGSSEDPAQAEILVKGLSDREALVRRDAGRGARDIQNAVLIEPLLEHLKSDEDVPARVEAARSLVRYNEPRVLRGLIDALEDRDAAVMEYARRSLVTLTGQELPYDAKEWLRWYQQRFGTLGEPARRR